MHLQVIDWCCLLPPVHPGGEATMRAGKVTLALSGASLGKVRFKAVEFFPEQPDEMGLWPKGYAPG